MRRLFRLFSVADQGPSRGQRSTGHREAGAALVEMAVLIPVLVLLLAGILEIGRVLQVWVITTNAAREGARFAALGHAAADIRQHTRDYLLISLAERDDVVIPGLLDITVENAEGAPGGPVSVGLATEVETFTPLIQEFFPSNPVPVRAGLTMRLQ